MIHLPGPFVCRRPHWWSPRRRGRRTRARNIPGRNFSMAPRNIQMAAIDSPLFGFVGFNFLLKLHLVEETFVAQKKCTYYQNGTQFSIKNLSSTNVWLTWITCMVMSESAQWVDSVKIVFLINFYNLDINHKNSCHSLIWFSPNNKVAPAPRSRRANKGI